MTISFGLSVPAGPPKDDIASWVTDVDVSVTHMSPYIDSLWMTDHFVWDDLPTYEAWTVITYLATRYTHLDVGPIVLGQSYRNPAMLAKMVATLQQLTDGRFIMGIGAGWKEDEYHAYGYPYPRAGIRLEQLEDTLEILMRLWKEPGQVSYEGMHYSIQNAYCEPKPHPVPPILVGGGGNKTMRLAARYADIWNMPDTPVEVFAERVAILHQHCESQNRDPQSLELSWFGRFAVGETEDEALALSNGEWTRERAIVGTMEQVQEQIQAFIDVGVTKFIFEMLGVTRDETRSLIFESLRPFIDSNQNDS